MFWMLDNFLQFFLYFFVVQWSTNIMLVLHKWRHFWHHFFFCVLWYYGIQPKPHIDPTINLIGFHPNYNLHISELKNGNSLMQQIYKNTSYKYNKIKKLLAAQLTVFKLVAQNILQITTTHKHSTITPQKKKYFTQSNRQLPPQSSDEPDKCSNPNPLDSTNSSTVELTHKKKINK